MKGMKVLMSSTRTSANTTSRDDWGTPPDLFAELNEEFNFTIDVCANETNAKLPRYWNEEQDGLSQDWAGQTFFCNPPYGKADKWVLKAWLHGVKYADARGVLLLGARPDTLRASMCSWGNVRYLRGRLWFEGAKYPATFPSVVVVFDGPMGTSQLYGNVWTWDRALVNQAYYIPTIMYGRPGMVRVTQMGTTLDSQFNTMEEAREAAWLAAGSCVYYCPDATIAYNGGKTLLKRRYPHLLIETDGWWHVDFGGQR